MRPYGDPLVTLVTVVFGSTYLVAMVTSKVLETTMRRMTRYGVGSVTGSTQSGAANMEDCGVRCVERTPCLGMTFSITNPECKLIYPSSNPADEVLPETDVHLYLKASVYNTVARVEMPNCDGDFSRVGCVQEAPNTMSYDECHTYCQSLAPNVNIPTPDTLEKLGNLTAKLPSSSIAWLRVRDEIPDGTWVFVKTGQAVHADFWYTASEPILHSGEANCAYLTFQKFRSSKCGLGSQCVCQAE